MTPPPPCFVLLCLLLPQGDLLTLLRHSLRKSQEAAAAAAAAEGQGAASGSSQGAASTVFAQHSEGAAAECLPWVRRLELAADVCRGMHCLHDYHRTAHLDLKSSNVLLYHGYSQSSRWLSRTRAHLHAHAHAPRTRTRAHAHMRTRAHLRRHRQHRPRAADTLAPPCAQPVSSCFESF